MSEDFNACAKAQLLTYVPMALKKQLKKHDKVIGQNTKITRDEELDVVASMKATLEQQKAAKAIISHVEALIKLARLVIDDSAINETPEESKQELLDIIKEAQERVTLNRKSISNDAANN